MLGSCEKPDVKISIREAANKLEDENIKRKIGNYKYKEGSDFIGLEVKYHHECKREYLNKVRNTKSNNTFEQSVYSTRKSTFEDIVSYIKESVVRKNKPQLASDILERYKQIYQVKGGCKEDVDSYSTQDLTSKLKSALDKEVLIKTDGKKWTIIWKNSSMPINQATQIAKQNHGEDKTTIWKCAIILRNEILSLKSSPLNEGWSVSRKHYKS